MSLQKGVKMESQDYDLVREEERQEENRRIYQETLEEMTDELDNVFRQANIDDIDLDDVVQAIIEAFESANDMKIKIERV